MSSWIVFCSDCDAIPGEVGAVEVSLGEYVEVSDVGVRGAKGWLSTAIVKVCMEAFWRRLSVNSMSDIEMMPAARRRWRFRNRWCSIVCRSDPGSWRGCNEWWMMVVGCRLDVGEAEVVGAEVL
jgi:hypothetical protein